MNCNEYRALVSPAVDNRLLPDELVSFHEHGKKCIQCRNEYEGERLTKLVVGNKVKRMRTPERVMRQVSERLEQEGRASASVPALGKGWRAFFAMPAVKPALAFGITCIAVIVLLTLPNTPPDTTSSTASLDFIQQSLSNYHSVIRGDIKPQLASSAPENLLTFFTGKTDFAVVLPKMKDCRLVGGVSNEYSGVKLAHVMYQHGNETIYMSQTCWETAQKSGKVRLPDDAKEELKRTGWFAKSFPDGSTMVLWTKNRTLCSAVAHMSKDDLIACLTDGGNAGAPGW